VYFTFTRALYHSHLDIRCPTKKKIENFKALQNLATDHSKEWQNHVGRVPSRGVVWDRPRLCILHSALCIWDASRIWGARASSPAASRGGFTKE